MAASPDVASILRDARKSALLRMKSEISRSIKSMKMMDRSMTMPDIKPIGRRDRGSDKRLGVAYGAFKVFAVGQTCGDR
jgi:hypothetical protein